jgi:predicted dehydrogenase
MPHTLHPFLIASGNPEYPVTVTSVGTQTVSKDREVADTVMVTAVFPSGWTMMFTGSTVNEQGLPQIIRGHKGTLYFGGGSVEVRPERPFAEEIERGFILQNSPGEDVFRHETDWLTAIRTNKQPSCNADLATKVQTIVSLAEMAQRTGKAIHFDPKTRKITTG